MQYGRNWQETRSRADSWTMRAALPPVKRERKGKKESGEPCESLPSGLFSAPAAAQRPVHRSMPSVECAQKKPLLDDVAVDAGNAVVHSSAELLCTLVHAERFLLHDPELELHEILQLLEHLPLTDSLWV